MLLFLSLVFANSDCEKAMRLRGMTPALDATAPINSRIWFGSVGSGTATHFTLSVYTNDTAISGSVETDCYIHEGPLDNHCNMVFTPEEPLLPNTDYRVRANATEEHMNPSMFVDSWFTTVDEESILDAQASTLIFQGYQARNITNPNSCKWKDSFQHNFLVEFPSPTEFDSIVQVYEIRDENPQKLVHTLFIPIGSTEADFRQVVVPGDEGEHCYYVQHEDIAGHKAQPSNTICFDPFAVDEPATEPAQEDTAEEGFTPPEENTTSQTTKEETTGCSTIPSPATPFFLWIIALCRRKKTTT